MNRPLCTRGADAHYLIAELALSARTRHLPAFSERPVNTVKRAFNAAICRGFVR